jgi:hypothetical protein
VSPLSDPSYAGNLSDVDDTGNVSPLSDPSYAGNLSDVDDTGNELSLGVVNDAS